MRVGNDIRRSREHGHILSLPACRTKGAYVVRVSRSHELDLRVRYAESDQMGVVYHTNYLVWCEMGRTELIRSLIGRSYADLEREGYGLAVSELTIRYHGAARYDNLVRVRTTIGEVRSRSVAFDYLITNAETGERFASA